MRLRVENTTRARIALVGALALLLAAAWAGAFAPAAAAAPDAATIDAYLAAHGSPMIGTGATFVAEGQRNGVDPAFLVAIAGAESSFGRFLYSEGGDQSTYNAFNWFYGPTWPASDFDSWEEAITRTAAGLGGEWYHGSGLYSVYAIAPKYCPDGTADWINNVVAFMNELGGDPDDTRLSAAGVAAAVTPTPAPASTEPGLVALSGTVKLDAGDREVGQRIYAWFTLTNSGGQPIELKGIRLAIRGPGGAVRDQVSDQPATLAGGQSLEVSSSWPLDLAGRWHGWIEVTHGGENLIGEQPAFEFRVRLPQEQVLQRWERRDLQLSSSL